MDIFPFDLSLILNGGLAIAGGTALFSYFKQFLVWLYNQISNYFYFEIEIESTWDIGKWTDEWLITLPFNKACRKFYVYNKYPAQEDEPFPIISSPGNNTLHYFFYKNKLVLLNKSKTEPKHGESSLKTFYIKIFTKNRKIKDDFINDIIKFQEEKNKNKINIFNNCEDYWDNHKQITGRDINTVILPNNLKNNIIDDITQFRKKKQWYSDMGIPYRRGYLFYGVNGSGKTSLVSAIAKYFGLDLYVLNLNSNGSDTNLFTLFSLVKQNSIILIEDIDCYFNKRDNLNKSVKSVSFTGLLNALDGFNGSENRLLFITTNHIENIDSALIRGGRIDLKVEFKKADNYQTKELFKRFYQTDNEKLIDKISLLFPENTKSPAELQELFMQHNIYYWEKRVENKNE